MDSDSTYAQLIKGHTPEAKLAQRSIFVTQEKKSVYTLTELDKKSVAFTVDGDIITNGPRCDKLLLIELDAGSDPQWIQVFIELKGKNVVHALDQLLTTMDNPIFSHPTNAPKRFARLVSTKMPSSNSNPEFEKRREQFKQKGHDFKRLKSNQPESFSSIVKALSKP